jgi:hypothetical protein
VKYAETFVASTEGTHPRTYICPRDCEHGKIYPASAFVENCPVCKSRLYQIRNGKIEHSSHSARHNGIFFMAPDGWHHVEGALVSASEFRVYIYDNFTEPSAEQSAGTADIASADAHGNRIGTVVPITLTLSADKTYLTGTIPTGTAAPLAIAAHVKFESQSESVLFNFAFAH